MASYVEENNTENMDIPTFHFLIDNNDEELKKKYINQVNKHNDMINNNRFPDSGFDLMIPYESSGTIEKNHRNKVNYKIIGVMIYNNKYLPYYIYPRSSISKTPLQMCNNVGIIDSGYRGNLMSYFSNHNTVINDNEDYSYGYDVIPYSRLTQICDNQLRPFYVKIEENLDFFMESTRGSGGFGSTGN